MVDHERKTLCLGKLADVAKNKGTIRTDELKSYLKARSLGPYLNEIYDEEIRCGRPDLTLVVVGRNGQPHFLSLGAAAQSVRFNKKNRRCWKMKGAARVPLFVITQPWLTSFDSFYPPR